MRASLLSIGVLTVLVMGGVVAIALHHRATAPDDEPTPEAPRVDVPADADCRPDAASPASLRFDLPSDVLDVGPVKQGVVLSREVVVRNVGSGPLCVPDPPRTGCGCVQASWVGPTRVPPTRTAIVRVQIDTKNYEGRVEKDVSLATNDPARPEARFRVRYEVMLGVMLDASPEVSVAGVVQFGRHALGKPATVVVSLRSSDRDPEWTVTGVEAARTKLTFTVALPTRDEHGSRHVAVTIVHPPSSELDLEEDAVRISTNHPDRPEIVLVSRLLVTRKFTTSPTSMRFGAVGGGAVAPARKVLVFAGEAGTPLRVTGASVEGQGFVVGEPVDRGAEGVELEVRYDDRPRRKGPLEAKLVVRIDDPEMPVLEVPLTADVG